MVRPAQQYTPLSPMERRILGLATKGMTDKEICADVGLSVTTVRTHWSRLRKKLGVCNRAQAVAEALELEAGGHLRMMQARVLALHRSLNQRGLAVWEFHPENDCVLADEISAQIFGSGVKRGLLPAEQFLDAVDEDGRRELMAMLHDARGELGHDGVRHRICDGSGKTHAVHTRATRVQVNDHTVVLCTTEAASTKG